MSPDPAELRRQIDAFGWWYHDIDLGGGVTTSPDHPDGDYPRNRFARFEPHLPADLTGLSVLDIGCNAGFFALELKRRGAARVVGVDYEEAPLAQAAFAADHLGLDIELHRLDCYDVGQLGEQFDLVVFLGVLYHLRHPLLALDIVRSVTRGTVLFQTVLAEPTVPLAVPDDLTPAAAELAFANPAFPGAHFVEHRFNGDPTNWWLLNRNGLTALFRAAGFHAVTETDDPDSFLLHTTDCPPGALLLEGFEARSRHAVGARQLLARQARGRLRAFVDRIRGRATGTSSYLAPLAHGAGRKER